MKKVTTGIENFKEIIDQNYYYVDKTKLIEVVMADKVSLFTRPRRFGKTLSMSMLYYFFSNKETKNAYLFDGLEITQNSEMVKYQNQYPVISISLKEVKGNTFSSSLASLRVLIQLLCKKFNELEDSLSLDQNDKEILKSLRNMSCSQTTLEFSLLYLSEFLNSHYHKKVILLIDEYDVPLQAAYKYGYYDEMSHFMGNFLGACLKTNDALEKGVMTGCLRIAKESIFTGLNNFKVHSIFDDKSADCFGFTQQEIDKVLNYYHLEPYKDKVKEWYNGYLFGSVDIYNPWSTLYFIDDLLVNKHKEPISYWANTSGNDIVYKYIKNSDESMKQEFELLVNNHSITKKIYPELTYREMEDIDNIYSFLLFTGYLKVEKKLGNDMYSLIIPNKEIKKTYEDHFNKFFREYSRDKQKELIEALKSEKVELANRLLNDILQKAISFYDNYESFYHGFMVGLFSGYQVKSNRESGLGRFDLVILPTNIFESCVVIECKKSEQLKDLLADSKHAKDQIVEKGYMNGLINDGYMHVMGYGISFYKKNCYITKVE